MAGLARGLSGLVKGCGKCCSKSTKVSKGTKASKAKRGKDRHKKKKRKEEEDDDDSDDQSEDDSSGIFDWIPCCGCFKGAYKSDTPGRDMESQFLPVQTEMKNPPHSLDWSKMPELRITAIDIVRGRLAAVKVFK